jgi:anti-sigma regulatory factor (Ser/Thr protein kinase)/GNAT superfamily N-acetyltransferase
MRRDGVPGRYPTVRQQSRRENRTMDLELLLSNEPRALPGMRAMTRESLRQLPLEDATAAAIEQLVSETVAAAVEHAYPPGEQGSIRLTIREKLGKLEILVRDYGIPQDVRILEERLHESAAAGGRFGSATALAVDELHWLGFGREGKALQLVKWLHEERIAARPDAGDLTPFHDQTPPAPAQQYVIRRMIPEEAVQVSQLMYRAYGNTYFNDDVYYPERVAAQNAHEAVLSFVAVGADGRVAGHYALELNQPGPVAEGGQAVVDPAHRGRGLLEKLKAAALAAAKQHGLTGWYADAVAVHTMTQKSNATHGGVVTAADLAIAPRTESFRELAVSQPQRVTCLLYFHWLEEPRPRIVSVPARHREIVTDIYTRLGCPVEFHDAADPAGHGTLTVQMETGGAKAFLRAGELGADTVHLIAHAKRELVERSRMEAVYVELPLHDQGTARVAERLEGEGFGFIGIAPHFDAAGDLLRLAYLVEPQQREPIKVFEEAADRLVAYALAEQARVRIDL